MTIPLILDTDIDTDCDDAGAMAVLHALADAGECRPLGVVCSVPVPECVGAVQAINTWYGRGEIPVGLVSVPGYLQSEAWQTYREHREKCGAHGVLYNALIGSGHAAQAEDAVALYRRLLAGEADGSVAICAIGTLTALAQLLDSPADAASPLPGRELVRKKVCELSVMAIAAYPTGADRFNWHMDRTAAAQVIRDWPTRLTVSEHGQTIPTGARFVAAALPGQPVREAYTTFLGGPGRDRPSWDLVTVLYAVRGLAGPFARSGEHTLDFDATSGAHVWRLGTAQAPRSCVRPLPSDAVMATLLEDLMLASLNGR
jgi:hypothetical protein